MIAFFRNWLCQRAGLAASRTVRRSRFSEYVWTKVACSGMLVFSRVSNVWRLVRTRLHAAANSFDAITQFAFRNYLLMFFVEAWTRLLACQRVPGPIGLPCVPRSRVVDHSWCYAPLLRRLRLQAVPQLPTLVVLDE